MSLPMNITRTKVISSKSSTVAELSWSVCLPRKWECTDSSLKSHKGQSQDVCRCLAFSRWHKYNSFKKSINTYQHYHQSVIYLRSLHHNHQAWPQVLNNYFWQQLTHLKGDDKAEEKSHVDDTEDDCLLERNQKKESSTRQNPVLAQFVPHPATYTNVDHNALSILHLVITKIMATDFNK